MSFYTRRTISYSFFFKFSKFGSQTSIHIKPKFFDKLTETPFLPHYANVVAFNVQQRVYAKTSKDLSQQTV